MKQFMDQQAQAAQEAQNAPIKQVMDVENLKAQTTLQTNAAKAEIDQQKTNQQGEIERMKIESAERMKAMEFDHQAKMKAMELEAQSATQIFIAEMNSKTKLIEAEAGHNAARQSASDTEFGKLMPDGQSGGLDDHPMLSFMRDIAGTHAAAMHKLDSTIASMHGAMASMTTPKQIKLPSGQIVTLETMTRQ